MSFRENTGTFLLDNHEKIRVAMVSRFPKDVSRPVGGVQAVTLVLASAVAQLPVVELHVVSVEDVAEDRIEILSNGLTIHRLSKSKCPQVFDIWAGPGRRSLNSCLRRLQPDIVHVHETWGLAMGRFEIPTVFTIHGFDDSNVIADASRLAWLRAPIWRLSQRVGLRRQRWVISITPYVRKRITCLTKARIFDIENPVAEKFFCSKRREEPGRVLTVGWISERKNTLGSIRAFAEARRLGLGTRLILAGSSSDPSYLTRVRQEVASLGLTDHVEFLGAIEQDRLVTELQKASVMLLPSFQENSPMAIAEAMAAGVPVVVSNRCGMPYLVEEGFTGHLVDPMDEAAVASALVGLLRDPALRKKMGKAAALEARRRFYPSAVAEATLAVYRIALAAIHSNAS